MTLRVEYFYDDEAGTWGFSVPVLRIVGGGGRTRDETERRCLAAIDFALDEPIVAEEELEMGDVVEYDVEVNRRPVPAVAIVAAG